MATEATPASVSSAARWTGYVLAGLIVLMLTFSGVMKFAGGKELEEGFAHLGWPLHLAVVLGTLEIACTLLYAIPRTAVLGAILLTGYMGGAIATHVRLEEPIFMHVGIGVVIWLSLYLRDPRLRSLVPLRS